MYVIRQKYAGEEGGIHAYIQIFSSHTHTKMHTARTTQSKRHSVGIRAHSVHERDSKATPISTHALARCVVGFETAVTK